MVRQMWQAADVYGFCTFSNFFDRQYRTHGGTPARRRQSFMMVVEVKPEASPLFAFDEAGDKPAGLPLLNSSRQADFDSCRFFAERCRGPVALTYP
jgi:hypothetical protein